MKNQSDYYDQPKGCEKQFKHMFWFGLTITIIVFTLLFLWEDTCKAQPITVQPVHSLFQGYTPTQPVILNRPVPGPRGPKGYDGRQVITVHDTMLVKPNIDLSMYITRDELSDRLSDIDTVNNTTYMYINKSFDNTYRDFNLAVIPHQYRNRGLAKILSGAYLQVVSLGLIAYANIPKYEFKDISTTIYSPYTYEEYILVITPGKPIKDWCGQITGYTPETHELMSTSKTAYTVCVDTKQTTTLVERNKTTYYVIASALTAFGVVLEVSGIDDYHKAKIYVTQNSVGVSVNF